jgi:hypothetical protein
MLRITVSIFELGSNVYMTSSSSEAAATAALSLLFSHHFIDVKSFLENLV